jgi:hypothetical protein
MAAQVDRGAALAGQPGRLVVGDGGWAEFTVGHISEDSDMNIVIGCLAAFFTFFGWMTLEAKREAVARATDALTQELEYRVVPLLEPPPKA